MWHGPIELRPLDSPSGAQLRQQWEALHDKANTLRRPESRVVSQDSMGAPSRKHSALTAGILLKLAPTACWPPCMTARRTVSVLGPDSSAKPAAPHQPGWIPSALKRGEFQTALRRRLGLAILSLNAPILQCGCGHPTCGATQHSYC
jgi:hypothetical protein